MRPEILKLTGDEDSFLYRSATAIIRATQGHNSIVESHVKNYAAGEKSVAYAAFIDSKLVGVGTARIETQSESSVYKSIASKLPEVPIEKTVGFLRTLSVDPTFQGHGIGKKLTQARIDWLKSKDCARVYSISWANGMQFNSGNVFKSIGFRLIEILPLFYRAALIDARQVCRVCAGACNCSAEIYVLEL